MGLKSAFESGYMRLHKAVYIRTDGRVGHGMLVVVPSLLLRTTGRRSGGQRTTALSYARDGEDYLLVASNNAKDQSPGWYFNICANPQVGIQVRREHLPGVARAVHKGDPDYARLWRLANDNNSGRYDAYQRRTDRAIPLVVVRAT